MKRLLVGVVCVVLVLSCLAGCGPTESKYRSDLENLTEEMLDNAARAEEIITQYATVWSYCIKSKGAIPVKEMSAITGLDHDIIVEYFAINAAGNIDHDFSPNIYSLKKYYEGHGEIRQIEKTANDCKDKIAKLNKPPAKFEKVYDEVLDMYTYTEEYIQMALDPEGSLKSFNDDKSRLSGEISNKYKRIKAIMP